MSYTFRLRADCGVEIIVVADSPEELGSKLSRGAGTVLKVAPQTGSFLLSLYLPHQGKAGGEIPLAEGLPAHASELWERCCAEGAGWLAVAEEAKKRGLIQEARS